MSEVDSTLPKGFRVIPGFPRYAIDENATVLSICTNSGGQKLSWTEAKKMNPTVNAKHGYRTLCLCANGKYSTKRLHMLVLEAFHGTRPQGMEGRHLDGNKLNNNLSNLAWGTSFENHQDRVLHGTMCRGEIHYETSLTNSDVVAIRQRVASGEKQVDVAKDFEVTKSVISRIVLRKTWKHI